MTVKKVTAVALALALAAAALPVLADGNVTVRNRNSASVTNVVLSGANTGGNTAGGSTGGDGGNGGNVDNEGGNQNVNNAGTGNGGMGGNGGLGGTVTSGDATAEASVENDINNNHTEVDLCGCEPAAGDPTVPPTTEDVDNGDVKVKNKNEALVENGVGALAESGLNKAKGSRGGRGGNGGDIENYSGGQTDPAANGTQNVNNASTGSGADGGTGAEGGMVTSGKAKSEARAVNMVNHNWTRVVR